MKRTKSYKSLATYFTAIIFQNLIISVVAQLTNAANNWTDWDVCGTPSRPNCNRFRELTCEKQGVEKLDIECTASTSRDTPLEVYEQQLNSGCLRFKTDDVTNLCLQNILKD